MKVVHYPPGDDGALARTLVQEMGPMHDGHSVLALCGDAVSARWMVRVLQGCGYCYRARGRWLFVVHPWLRQLLLALRGLADEDDAAGNAALFAEPFFPIGIQERVRRLAAGTRTGQTNDSAWARARALVRDLRVRAQQGSVAAMVLALAEETGFFSHPSFGGVNSAAERELFWRLVSAVERECWRNGTDAVGFVPTIDAWLEDPLSISSVLGPPTARPHVQVVAVGELRPDELVETLVVAADRNPTGGHTTWSVVVPEQVELSLGEQGRPGTTIRVKRLFVVPS